MPETKRGEIPAGISFGLGENTGLSQACIIGEPAPALKKCKEN
jgi:hypothetical protein